MKTELQNLGNDIKTKRIENGLSQEELALVSNVERSQLSKIEKGSVNGVTFMTISRIYKSLGCDISFVKGKNSYYEIHPFVKWAGGKTQLLSTLMENVPSYFNRYYEPFVGGGALLFKIQPNDFLINDSNNDLICAFNCFKNKKDFEYLKEELIKHEANHNEEYYYKIREMDRDDNFKELPIYIRAARTIYLNKACFNGLYRVNSKGYYNVPSGKYKKVNCFDRDNFENLFVFFNKGNKEIRNEDFEQSIKDAKKGDFVYFDPPYDSFEDKDSFTSYNKETFGKNEQERLSKVFKELDKKGVYVMLSNHNTEFINNLYKDYKIEVVNAKRAINSKGTGRGYVEEVIIKNYEN